MSVVGDIEHKHAADRDHVTATKNSTGPRFFVGWDVGGWNCDRNANSRDAIVILDSELRIVGHPWRGNLRTTINAAQDTTEWIAGLFSLCRADPPVEAINVTLGIDTPLGFSNEFVALITGQQIEPELGDRYETNTYLFRRTERHLFEYGLKPLSAIKDMIGSQATKGLHVLAKFAPVPVSCGIWTSKDPTLLTAIEAYPSACKESDIICTLRSGYGRMDHEDNQDALTCALIAFLFAARRDQLASPCDDVPISEGWIWAPKDIFRQEVA